jgi:hypothetical protein
MTCDFASIRISRWSPAAHALVASIKGMHMMSGYASPTCWCTVMGDGRSSLSHASCLATGDPPSTVNKEA